MNDALQAINPRYQPIGFSITSMESCSRSVMEDAVLAAETAVFTIMSVIGKNLTYFIFTKSFSMFQGSILSKGQVSSTKIDHFRAYIVLEQF